MTQASHIPHKDLRILIVDDHMIMRKIISQSLTDLGCEQIETASNGVDAFNEIETQYNNKIPYHIVFLDWSMPEMDGIEVLKTCRKNKKYNDMAIIMLTAKSEESDVIHAIQNGATSYIAKPTTLENVAEHTNKTIKWLEKQGINQKSDPYESSKKEDIAKTKEEKNIPPEIYQKLEPVIMTEMKNIFSSLFNVQTMTDQKINTIQDKDMTCIGTLYQNNMEVALRFIFQQELLTPLLSQIYSTEHLQDEEIYSDAACEIVNILCNQVKNFLNKQGYSLDFDLPTMKSEKEERTDTMMNVAFSLEENNRFYIDVEETQET